MVYSLFMELIADLTDQNIGLTSTPDTSDASFTVRRAVRAILKDGDKIAIMYIGQNGNFILPGGGVDPEESLPVALARELEEEVGCKGKIEKELGIVLEQRYKQKMIQVSYIFVCQLIGLVGTPNFTEKVRLRSFECRWLNPSEVLTELLQEQPPNYGRTFCHHREIAIIKHYLGQQS